MQYLMAQRVLLLHALLHLHNSLHADIILKYSDTCRASRLHLERSGPRIPRISSSPPCPGSLLLRSAPSQNILDAKETERRAHKRTLKLPAGLARLRNIDQVWDIPLSVVSSSAGGPSAQVDLSGTGRILAVLLPGTEIVPRC